MAAYAYAVKVEDGKRTSSFSTANYDYLGEDFDALLNNMLGHFWHNIGQLEDTIEDDDRANKAAQEAADDAAQSDFDCQASNSCRASQILRNLERQSGADHSHSGLSQFQGARETTESSESGTKSNSDSGESRFSNSEGTSGTTVTSQSIVI
jgi:hypothetical protein